MSSFRIAVCGGGMTMQAGIRAYPRKRSKS